MIAGNTLSGTGFSSSGTGSQIQESGTRDRSVQDDFYNKKKISIEEDSIDGDDIDQVNFLTQCGRFAQMFHLILDQLTQ